MPIAHRAAERSEFGTWLDGLMRARGLNRQDIGRRAGVDPSNVSRWTMNATPSPDSCRLLADALGVPYAEILTRAGYLAEAAEIDQRHPIRARLHQLIDTMAPDTLEPTLAQLELIARLAHEAGHDR